mmetsp:Transcript_107408/g.269411  ORF Transcript_107408/g.269411 Transcript_107408/m.269411 type:complete len:208 (-) Transcript_107408:1936-2559(-)
MASCAGSDSKPLRKGSSASPVLPSSASAFKTSSSASAIIPEHTKRSLCSLAAATTVASFFSAAEIFDRMAESSSRSTPEALLSFTSTSLDVAVSLVWADAVAFSMRSTCSADNCSSPLAATAVAATLSTSPSVLFNLTATSLSMVFTRRRSSASLMVFLIFAISCCTLLTRVCSLPSSLPEPVPAMASFLRSPVFCSKCFLATTRLA